MHYAMSKSSKYIKVIGLLLAIACVLIFVDTFIMTPLTPKSYRMEGFMHRVSSGINRAWPQNTPLSSDLLRDIISNFNDENNSLYEIVWMPTDASMNNTCVVATDNYSSVSKVYIFDFVGGKGFVITGKDIKIKKSSEAALMLNRGDIVFICMLKHRDTS